MRGSDIFQNTKQAQQALKVQTAEKELRVQLSTKLENFDRVCRDLATLATLESVKQEEKKNILLLIKEANKIIGWIDAKNLSKKPINIKNAVEMNSILNQINMENAKEMNSILKHRIKQVEHIVKILSITEKYYTKYYTGENIAGDEANTLFKEINKNSMKNTPYGHIQFGLGVIFFGLLVPALVGASLLLMAPEIAAAITGTAVLGLIITLPCLVFGVAIMTIEPDYSLASPLKAIFADPEKRLSESSSHGVDESEYQEDGQREMPSPT